MEYHNNILCITIDEWLAAGLSYDMFKNDRRRNYLKVTRPGGNGRKLLIDYASIIKDERKRIFEGIYGDGKQHHQNQTLRDCIKTDDNAAQFFTEFELEDNRRLPDATIRNYIANASILNALIKMLDDCIKVRKSSGGGAIRNFYKLSTDALKAIKVEYGHTLPSNPRHLQRVLLAYRENGYPALLSKKFSNENRRKVTTDVEHLLMSLYSMPNKPFAFNVWEMYKQFIDGKITVVDSRTGEMFDRNKFVDKKGNLIEISEATVWNYLNNPKNRAIVDKMRSGGFRYNNEHRPHHHRHSSICSLSKISMDDLDLPRKMSDGKRVKCYRAYDVTSGCIIGYAYSRNKDEALFLDCLRDAFRLIERNGFGMPAEVEVEHHLVNKFFNDLAVIFPYLRICNPGNSQEKRAEHFNRAKKYSIDKKYFKQGRWWSRHEAYQVDVDKIDNEFKEKTYTYEEIVADDIAMTKEYNNSLHPKQKLYPNMTRWDVLKNELNPDLKPFSKALVYKTIGEHTETTIRRNQYVNVQYDKYGLPDPEVINRLLPNNYTVDAHYLPDDNGMISEVFLYQRGKFICRCEKISAYNESTAEQTDKDKAAYTEQSKYVSRFDKMTKDGKNDLAKVVLIETADQIAMDIPEPEIVAPVLSKRNGDDIEAMLAAYNPDDYAQDAKNKL